MRHSDSKNSNANKNMNLDHTKMVQKQKNKANSTHTGTGTMKGQMNMSMAGIPDWLYYSSIIIILILSLFLLEFLKSKKPSAGNKNRYKKYELTKFKIIIKLIESRLFQFINQAFVSILFIFILFAGFYGKQLPGKNIAPILTWNIWWIGLIFIILFFGKLWCYACPWYALSDWISRLSIFKIKKDRINLGMKWPKKLSNIYPATILFLLLTWLELGFNVTMDPEATASLGVLMFGLVFVPALLFEKKSFCRYGCLVGRISGLYAMFSPVEVRARSKDVCNKCKSEDCFNGNSNGFGCPTEQLLKEMDENTYCIMCAECFRTCPHTNVALNIRPFGKDLVLNEKTKKDEAYLALIIFSITAFHGLTMTSNWKILISYIQKTLSINYLPAFSLAMFVSLAIPIITYSLFIMISKAITEGVSYSFLYMKYAYGLIPIALFYHIAHNVEHFFMEGQKLFVLISDPFGYGWNIFGTADRMFKPILSLHNVWFIQVILIILGHVFGVYISHRHAHQVFPDRKDAIKSQLPVLFLMVLFSVLSLWLVAQPMEMRTGM